MLTDDAEQVAGQPKKKFQRKDAAVVSARELSRLQEVQSKLHRQLGSELEPSMKMATKL